MMKIDSIKVHPTDASLKLLIYCKNEQTNCLVKFTLFDTTMCPMTLPLMITRHIITYELSKVCVG